MSATNPNPGDVYRHETGSEAVVVAVHDGTLWPAEQITGFDLLAAAVDPSLTYAKRALRNWIEPIE